MYFVSKYKLKMDILGSNVMYSNLTYEDNMTVYIGDSTLSLSSWMFERKALQEYILLCCQNPAGGLLDKPGK